MLETVIVISFRDLSNDRLTFSVFPLRFQKKRSTVFSGRVLLYQLAIAAS